MASWEKVSEQEVLDLVKRGEYRRVKDLAVDELSEAFDIENVEPISLEVSDKASAEIKERKVVIPDHVNDAEPDRFSKEYVQGSIIFHEVAHILAEDAFRSETGERRDSTGDLTLWNCVADEMLASISCWGEKWSFQRGEEIGEEKMKQDLDTEEEEILLFHALGYRLSEYASKEDVRPSRLVRMSYTELRQEFNDTFAQIKDEVEERHETSIQFV
ncbi:MAG: hypothetical protein ABEJ83_05770 [Candidatus Nanohaloarchaea archaeon]